MHYADICFHTFSYTVGNQQHMQTGMDGRRRVDDRTFLCRICEDVLGGTGHMNPCTDAHNRESLNMALDRTLDQQSILQGRYDDKANQTDESFLHRQSHSSFHMAPCTDAHSLTSYGMVIRRSLLRRLCSMALSAYDRKEASY